MEKDVLRRRLYDRLRREGWTDEEIDGYAEYASGKISQYRNAVKSDPSLNDKIDLLISVCEIAITAVGVGTWLYHWYRRGKRGEQARRRFREQFKKSIGEEVELW